MQQRQMRGEIKHDDRKERKRYLNQILESRRQIEQNRIIKQNKISSPTGLVTKIRRVFRKKTPNAAQYIKYEPAKLADTASIRRQLSAVKTPPIDLTLLDVNMPEDFMRDELP